MPDTLPTPTAGTRIVGLTAEVVVAYVTHHRLAASELPGLIAGVHAALSAPGRSTATPTARAAPPVPIKKTITPDALISLEDGKPYRTLKRHLGSYGLTPDQYRAKWGLPTNYPMVAANYAAERAAQARAVGLGRRTNKPTRK